jgi:hypothetical protein
MLCMPITATPLKGTTMKTTKQTKVIQAEIQALIGEPMKHNSAVGVAKKQATVTERFWIVIRGINKAGEYKRRVKVVNGTYDEACEVLAAKGNEFCVGLKNAICNIKQLA